MRQAEWEELILSLTMTPVDLKEVYHGSEEYATLRYCVGPLVNYTMEFEVNDRAKIRQVLQVMATRGLIRHTEAGKYVNTMKCAHGGCTDVPRDDRRTCETHLDSNLQRWHEYQTDRVLMNRCITAGCKRQPRIKKRPTGTRIGARRELRCKPCAEQNVRYVRAWMERRSCS